VLVEFPVGVASFYPKNIILKIMKMPNESKVGRTGLPRRAYDKLRGNLNLHNSQKGFQVVGCLNKDVHTTRIRQDSEPMFV